MSYDKELQRSQLKQNEFLEEVLGDLSQEYLVMIDKADLTDDRSRLEGALARKVINILRYRLFDESI